MILVAFERPLSGKAAYRDIITSDTVNDATIEDKSVTKATSQRAMFLVDLIGIRGRDLLLVVVVCNQQPIWTNFENVNFRNWHQSKHCDTFP